jgi:D-arabinitol dehydrogenase (NADP+)
MARFPLIPGHELVGTVEALGDGVTRVALGEQVSVNPNVNCGRCEFCLAGRPIHCTSLQGFGSNFPGFFAEYVVAPERLVFSTEGLPIDTAVFTEPASCATHGASGSASSPDRARSCSVPARPGCSSRSS